MQFHQILRYIWDKDNAAKHKDGIGNLDIQYKLNILIINYL